MKYRCVVCGFETDIYLPPRYKMERWHSKRGGMCTGEMREVKP